MQDNELPEFEQRNTAQVTSFVRSIFGKAFVTLKKYDDNHYRVVFDESYFTQSEEWTEPSKSQWGTLKKKFKRRDKRVFIFKENGVLDEAQRDAFTAKLPNKTLYYIDFGFFRYE